MSEKNLEAKLDKLPQTAREHKFLVKSGLLINSPYVTHMHSNVKHGRLDLDDGSHIYGEEGFDSWAKRLSQIFPERITEDKKINEEIIYSKVPEFKKYKGKHLLIIGGGPSTCELDFSKVDSDFRWSTNHFFLNPVLNKFKIDMAMIMGETNIESKDFLNYRNKFEPMIGFEIYHKWKNFKFDNYDNYFLMHTDFYSKLGSCVRMIIFACFLGVKKISFVGLDGPSYIIKGQHAFEKGKTSLPSRYSPPLYEWHYKLFWQYIKIRFAEVEFDNLGYGQEYHKWMKIDPLTLHD